MTEVHVDEDDRTVVICYTDQATPDSIRAAFAPFLDGQVADGQLTHDPVEGVWTVVLRKRGPGREITVYDLIDLPDGTRVLDAAGEQWLLVSEQDWREPLFARYCQEDGKIAHSTFDRLPSPVTMEV